MAWISPTGHIDVDNKWQLETAAYDNSVTTFAYCSESFQTWGGFLVLSHDVIPCSKVSLIVGLPNKPNVTIDIDAYYDDTWNHVYEGACLSGVLVERTILLVDGVPQSKLITSVRFRYYPSGQAG